MRQIKVPVKWYKEMANSHAKAVLNANPHIKQLTERIESLKAGQPHEIDIRGNVTLEELESYLSKAPSKDSLIETYKAFKEKYTPQIGMEGNLAAAKLHVEKIQDLIRGSRTIQSTFDAYNVVGIMQQKYYLSFAQTDKLMNFMDKKQLLY